MAWCALKDALSNEHSGKVIRVHWKKKSLIPWFEGLFLKMRRLRLKCVGDPPDSNWCYHWICNKKTESENVSLMSHTMMTHRKTGFWAKSCFYTDMRSRDRFVSWYSLRERACWGEYDYVIKKHFLMFEGYFRYHIDTYGKFISFW